MASPREDLRAAEHFDALKNEKMKTYAVRDGSQRVIKLYEAPLHVQDGEPCLVTVYEYAGSNTVPNTSLERSAYWNIEWESTIWDIEVHGVDGYVES